ncbi:MAG: hypothetical protein ACYCVY_02060 [Acidiferrobacteraceae bacterium]
MRRHVCFLLHVLPSGTIALGLRIVAKSAATAVLNHACEERSIGGQ